MRRRLPLPRFDGPFDGPDLGEFDMPFDGIPRVVPRIPRAPGWTETLSEGEGLVYAEYGLQGLLAYRLTQFVGETAEDFIKKWKNRKGGNTTAIDSKGERHVDDPRVIRAPWEYDPGPSLGRGTTVIRGKHKLPGDGSRARTDLLPIDDGPVDPPDHMEQLIPIRKRKKKGTSPIDIIDKVIGFVPKTGNPTIDNVVGITKTALKLKKAWDHWFDDTSTEHSAPSKRQRSSAHPNEGSTRGPGHYRGRSSISFMGNYVDKNLTQFGDTAATSRFYSLSSILTGNEQWNRQSQHVCLCASELRYRLQYIGLKGSVYSGYYELHIVYDRFGDLATDPPLFKTVDYLGGVSTNKTKLNMDDRYRFKLITSSRIDFPGDIPQIVPATASLKRMEYRRIGRLMSTYTGEGTDVSMGKLYLVVTSEQAAGYLLHVEHRLRFACE